MRKRLNSLFFALLLSFPFSILAQNNVGIGTTTPNPQAILELVASDKGFLMSRMNIADTAISGLNQQGMMFFAQDVNQIMFYDGTSWNAVSKGENYWGENSGNIFSLNTGNIGIGNTGSIDKKVHIEIPNTDANNIIGIQIDNDYAGTATKFGTVNDLSFEGTGIKYSTFNYAGQAAGINSPIYGTYNYIEHLGTGDAFGVFNEMAPSNTSGNVYGIFSLGEDYNFFSGRVGIETILPDHEIQVGSFTNNKDSYIAVKTGGGNLYKAGIILKHFNDDDGFTLESDETVNLFKINRHAGDTSTAMAISRLTGNVGIGTTSPFNKLDIEGGMAIGAAYSGGSTAPTDGLLVQGDVGIGTTSPFTKLHVNGDIYMSNASLIATSTSSDISTSTNVDHLYHNDLSNAWVFVSDATYKAAGNSQLQAGTISMSTSGNNYIEGSLGIGTNSPQEKVHIYNASAPTLRLTSATGSLTNAVNSGTIQLMEANADPGSGAFGGALTYDGSANQLKLQTYDDGDIFDGLFVARTTGNVGIKGAPATSNALDVFGTMRVSGEVNRTSTGGANMIPICYGMIGTGATINSGSGNFSVTNPTTGQYDITITGESFFFRDYIVTVTAVNTGYTATFTSGSGDLRVLLRNGSNNATNGYFAFVVYKP